MYEQVYFPLSIPPCISRCRLAYGATALSFFEFYPSQQLPSPTMIETMRAGTESFAFRLRAKDSYFSQIFSPLYTLPSFVLGIWKYRGKRFQPGFKRNLTAFIRRTDSGYFFFPLPPTESINGSRFFPTSHASV